MTGVMKIDIAESVDELRGLMKQQETSLNFAKIQSLYLLKINAVETVRHLAVLMGRSERTVHRWLSFYREGGMENLLWEAEPQGRPKKVSVEEVAMIQNELKDPDGFSSYKEIHFWASVVKGIEASYMTIYRVVKEELQAKLKVARPVSPKQLPGEVEAFKKNLVTELKSLQDKESDKISKYKKVRYWC